MFVMCCLYLLNQLYLISQFIVVIVKLSEQYGEDG